MNNSNNIYDINDYSKSNNIQLNHFNVPTIMNNQNSLTASNQYNSSLELAAHESAIADGLIPMNNMIANDLRSKRAGLRRGKWTTEEELYANRLIHEFKSGLLPLTDGTTLRTFLSKLLNCDPMRISKKFVGGNCIGKQVFRRRQQDLEKLTTEQIARCRMDLAELERKFLEKVAQTNRTKSGSGIKNDNGLLAPWMRQPSDFSNDYHQNSEPSLHSVNLNMRQKPPSNSINGIFDVPSAYNIKPNEKILNAKGLDNVISKEDSGYRNSMYNQHVDKSGYNIRNAATNNNISDISNVPNSELNMQSLMWSSMISLGGVDEQEVDTMKKSINTDGNQTSHQQIKKEVDVKHIPDVPNHEKRENDESNEISDVNENSKRPKLESVVQGGGQTNNSFEDVGLSLEDDSWNVPINVPSKNTITDKTSHQILSLSTSNNVSNSTQLLNTGMASSFYSNSQPAYQSNNVKKHSEDYKNIPHNSSIENFMLLVQMGDLPKPECGVLSPDIFSHTPMSKHALNQKLAKKDELNHSTQTEAKNYHVASNLNVFRSL